MEASKDLTLVLIFYLFLCSEPLIGYFGLVKVSAPAGPKTSEKDLEGWRHQKILLSSTYSTYSYVVNRTILTCDYMCFQELK